MVRISRSVSVLRLAAWANRAVLNSSRGPSLFPTRKGRIAHESPQWTIFQHYLQKERDAVHGLV